MSAVRDQSRSTKIGAFVFATDAVEKYLFLMIHFSLQMSTFLLNLPLIYVLSSAT